MLSRHLSALEGQGVTDSYFTAIDPDYMVDIAKLYLEYAPNEPSSTLSATPVLAKVLHCIVWYRMVWYCSTDPKSLQS